MKQLTKYKKEILKHSMVAEEIKPAKIKGKKVRYIDTDYVIDVLEELLNTEE